MRERTTRIPVLGALLALLMTAVVPSAAAQSAAPEVVSLDADDPVGGAIAWSRFAFPDGGAETVLLARDDAFADALASGGVQGLMESPLLLTPSERLAERTSEEIERLGAEQVIILGGRGAVSEDVADELRDRGLQVERLEGDTRLTTATTIAARFFPQADTAILARAFGDDVDESRAFADSLGAGALAANIAQPILLSDTAQLSEPTATYLRESAVTTVLVVGGPGALSVQVVAEIEALGKSVVRLAGRTRFETALIVGLAGLFEGEMGELRSGMDMQDMAEEMAGRVPPIQLFLVDGTDENAWAAGLPAAAAADNSLLLLTNGGELPPPTTALVLTFGTVDLFDLTVCAPLLPEQACNRAVTVQTAARPGSPESLRAVLNGGQEVPGPGHPTATGLADVLPTRSPSAVCYMYAVAGLDTQVTGAHIHRAPQGEAGPVVLPLAAQPEPLAFDCAFDLDEGLVRDIFEEPARFYVNIHTEAFPDGAVRGQLFSPRGQAVAFLTGDQEVPGPGDPDGFGIAEVFGRQDEAQSLCYTLLVLASSPITGAHIHEAPEGQAGPVRLPLETPPGDVPVVTACTAGVDAELVTDILRNPGDYYVNVHTEGHPDGAVRGQLVDADELRNEAQPAG
jgi:putative cell wall-binding protein